MCFLGELGGRDGHLNGNRGTESEGPDGMCSKRVYFFRREVSLLSLLWSWEGNSHLFPWLHQDKGEAPLLLGRKGSTEGAILWSSPGAEHCPPSSPGQKTRWRARQCASARIPHVCALGIPQTGSTGKATLVVLLESEIPGAGSFWSVASASAEPPQYLPALWQ